MDLQERVCSLQATVGQLESDSASADNRCFMLCFCLMLEVQHSGWLHCSAHTCLNVMKHHGTHVQTKQGGADIRVSAHLCTHDPAVGALC